MQPEMGGRREGRGAGDHSSSLLSVTHKYWEVSNVGEHFKERNLKLNVSVVNSISSAGWSPSLRLYFCSAPGAMSCGGGSEAVTIGAAGADGPGAPHTLRV